VASPGSDPTEVGWLKRPGLFSGRFHVYLPGASPAQSLESPDCDPVELVVEQARTMNDIKKFIFRFFAIANLVAAILILGMSLKFRTGWDSGGKADYIQSEYKTQRLRTIYYRWGPSLAVLTLCSCVLLWRTGKANRPPS
jgi:hypothetical protein